MILCSMYLMSAIRTLKLVIRVSFVLFILHYVDYVLLRALTSIIEKRYLRANFVIALPILPKKTHFDKYPQQI